MNRLDEERIRRLEAALRTAVSPSAEVHAEKQRARYIFIVVSDEFEGIAGSKRQAHLWRALYDLVEEEDRMRVEMLFAYTTTEFEELSAA